MLAGGSFRKDESIVSSAEQRKTLLAKEAKCDSRKSGEYGNPRFFIFTTRDLGEKLENAFLG